MNTYLILQHPGHNRVYYNLSGALALAELKIASTRLEVDCNAIEMITIEDIRYLSITTKEEISSRDVHILSRLSFVFAIFKLTRINGQNYFSPMAKYAYEYVDQKISSLLKYPGKTNELFTKMMINVALLSSDFNATDKIQLLDPVAGKGTTLFEGLVYGFDVMGIEIDPKSTHATGIFFKKYLETERYKHISNTRRVYGRSKADAIYIHEFDYAISKEEYKSDALRKKFGIVTGSSSEASKYFKKESFHVVVGDLPYGIAHGNSLDKKAASITRNPSEMLTLCLPEWHQILKKGGVLVIAWNAFVISKQKLEAIFLANGFHVFTESPYNDFEHLVDKSIKRDIIVAKKV